MESHSVNLFREVRQIADSRSWDVPTISDFARYFQRRYPFASPENISHLIGQIIVDNVQSQDPIYFLVSLRQLVESGDELNIGLRVS